VDGDLTIRSPMGDVDSRAEFWFEEGLLLVETMSADKVEYCNEHTGSYVVFAIPAGEETVSLRFYEVLDFCDLRTGP
jgi:hypothetical protein